MQATISPAPTVICRPAPRNSASRCSGFYGDFPQYSARIGAEISIEDRINSCMTRSMNGRPLPVDAPEMQKIVAYIKFIGSGVKPGQRLPGMGTGHMPELKRAASPARGAPLYAGTCAACHNTDGSGLRNNIADSDLGYLAPPLWGQNTFNDGAGMARDHYLCQFHPLQHAARHRLCGPAAQRR